MQRVSSIFLIWLLLSSCNPLEKTDYDLIISNVNLIDGSGSPLQSGVNVYIKNNRIAQIDTGVLSQKEKVINGTNKYLIPGLFDCHAHTSNYQKDFPRFMHYGVTSVFITGGDHCTNEYYTEMRTIGRQDASPAPRVFHTSQHFTMEGRHPVKTYASPLWVEGETVFFLRDTTQIEEIVKQVTKHPIVGIKLTIEDGPHPPWVERIPQEFINKVQKEASKNGTEVFAHVSDNIELQMALDAGIQNLVHWTGVDIDFERDTALLKQIYEVRPSWITTLMIDKSFIYPLFPEWIKAVKKENVFDDQDLVKANDSSYVARSRDYMNFMKEYLQLEVLTLKDIADFQVEDIKVLYNNGINFALGTDIGTFVLPGYSLHEEMQLMELGGMDRIDIIKMATHNAAVMMNANDSLGTIESGKLADMILLAKNPLEDISNTMAIEMVFKNGKEQKRINE